MARAFKTVTGYFENRVNICPKKPSTFITTVNVPVHYPSGTLNQYLLTSLRRGTGTGGQTYHSFFGTAASPPSASALGNVPTVSDYRIDSGNFGTSGTWAKHTYSGVEYSWYQGLGW